MNILELPNEILIKVASMLPLRDLKSLSLTCHRFSEVAIASVMVKKGVLWLNKIDEIPVPYGNKTIRKRFIAVETLKSSSRNYHAIGIALPVVLSKYELTMLQARLNALLLEKTAVRELHVIDSNNLQIITLWEHFPILFQTLDSLKVTVSDTPIRNEVEVDWEMPNLQRIQWNEQKFPSGVRYGQRLRINLYAPKLQKAIYEVPKELYSQNYDFHSMLVLKTVSQLRELQCVLGYQAVELLSENRLPALKRLCLIKEECRGEINWDIIAGNAPDLQHLEVRRDPTMPTGASLLSPFLVYCSMLTVLHLEGLNISDMFEASFLWSGIETLHLHECLMYSTPDKKLEVTLPNLRTLCISIYFIRNGNLVLNLPAVETLSLSKANGTLDILEMPKLKTLHMRIPFQRPMTFMKSRMSHLRNVILDTPVTFLPATEQNYRTLLSPIGKLSNVTVICRSGRAINNLLVNINREQPALKSLSIIGTGVMSKIDRNTLRTILKLSRLENLLMTNIQVSGSIPHPIPLPPQMRQLRIRSFCMPIKSRFISMKRSQRRMGTIVERRVLHHNFFSINCSQIPKFDDVQGSIDVCLDQLTDLYFSS
ncbi:uncharacterized protein LOC128711173 [Anopheles marshallii]|uniref:uncharacterized protein LOC128711173 n=1 Tax=Anopheles marshallii TaxID=1521116 RepID=UPI00237B45E3|nr:uncharacterized protein LOC128711173 [Anopheles marshallii]